MHNPAAVGLYPSGRFCTNLTGGPLTEDGARISANANTDWFFHPNGKTQQSNVPSLALETSDSVISITAQVSVNFSGTYDAGVLFIQTAPDQWAKLALEFSPQGFPTVVSVVTKQTSDDCDGPRLPKVLVWLRLYVQDEIVAFHFSEDGELWRFARTFSLPRRPDGVIKLGLAAQAPMGSGCEAMFRSVSVSHATIPDFRNGK